MSDSTPTTPLPTSATSSPEVTSRRPLIILVSVAAALLLAIIILLVALFGRGGGDPVAAPAESTTPSASPTPTPTETTPSPTPTPTETSAAPAEPAGPIASYTADDTSVNCDGESSVPVHFSWNATGVTLWFGVGTTNAKVAPYDTFPLVHEFDFDYQCGQGSGKQTYTITVEQSNGDLLSKTITITE